VSWLCSCILQALLDGRPSVLLCVWAVDALPAVCSCLWLCNRSLCVLCRRAVGLAYGARSLARTLLCSPVGSRRWAGFGPPSPLLVSVSSLTGLRLLPRALSGLARGQSPSRWALVLVLRSARRSYIRRRACSASLVSWLGARRSLCRHSRRGSRFACVDELGSARHSLLSSCRLSASALLVPCLVLYFALRALPSGRYGARSLALPVCCLWVAWARLAAGLAVGHAVRLPSRALLLSPWCRGLARGQPHSRRCGPSRGCLVLSVSLGSGLALLV